MVFKLGITGNIGSGKSTVGQILQDLGVPVIDADTVVHDLLAQDAETKAVLMAYFGPVILNTTTGQIDRAVLASCIFGPEDEAHRKAAEGILHPKVRVQIQAFFTENAEMPVAAALIPLLFENDLAWMVDETWLVAIDPGLQIERLQTQRAMALNTIHARLAAQLPQDEKLRRADWIVWNNGTVSELEAQIQARLQHFFHKD